MRFLLLLALLQQPAPPEVTTTVDRDHVTTGEEIVFSIRVSSTLSDPVRINLPALAGLEVTARSERTEVSVAPNAPRVTVLELHLRALAQGHWKLGPIQIRQGTSVVQGDPIEIVVEQGGGGISTALTARVRKILERAPPPGTDGKVGLTLILSTQSAMVGEQVDVLTAAWFPRDLRLQLRRPPTVEAPRIEGVWSYPQPVPTGIAESRLVSGRWYDLFILHQIVFPLSPGRVKVEPATLHYSVPVAFQFFSQEERYSLESGAATLQVNPLPDAGRPASFTGAIGHGLQFTRRVTPAAGKVGEPFTVEMTLSGEGNVSLWPAPDIQWPPGTRAYPDRTDERLSPTDGVMSGTKSFRYLLVADSAGSMILPTVTYDIFDPATLNYAVLRVPGISVPVARSGEGSAARVSPPPLMPGNRVDPAWSVMHTVPRALMAILLLLPPVILLLRLIRWRPAVRVARPVILGGLAGAERALDAQLARLSPGTVATSGLPLARALRLAGLDPALAEEFAATRDSLRAARFAPDAVESSSSLQSRAEALLRRLGDQAAPARRSRRIVAGVILLLASAFSTTWSQGTPAEELYNAGAFRAAADAFAARARLAPAVSAHWYNFGATQFRLGDDGAALAAWTVAHRLAPRQRNIIRALELAPPADEVSAHRLWTAPVTPEELASLGVLCWIVGWGGIVWTRGIRGRWSVLLTASLLLGAAAMGLALFYRRQLAVTRVETPLRISPHERAPQIVAVPGSSVLLVRARRGEWFLVDDPEGREGWIERAGIVIMSNQQ
ncbi:MAG: BatD family protein [Gemmatimonadota bacterium]